MKRILAAVDFSPVTPKVLKQASLLAQAFQSRLWLVHVATPEPEFVGYEPGPKSVRDQVAHRFRKEHRQLQLRTRRLQEKGIKAEALLVQGATAQTLLRQARSLKADLLIVGSHKHSKLYRLLFGDIGKNLLHKTPIPLLVVPG